ncbi:TetR/AcrR family transcriptional regulator [Candidatus Burkholderia verschuerenii]|uniref:TetR/AcrR family transcriptional regulator n=1 Tax=Candidatus Burkholderia verschuerenii TaxID=242163 RepID=UPI00067E22C5|nr:TetR/AcrR family transcriptional regulator [Candidatus Burkholderia verschuerenii]
MRTDDQTGLKARKQPRQARSQATVDAIFEATIQVLLAEGLPKLTTIKVAERAGVSVGSLYQYYPQKQALLFALLQRHLTAVSDTLVQAAESAHGAPLATMVSTIVGAFVKAKTRNVDASRALYGVAAELDSRGFVREIEARNQAAFAAMLASASDVEFRDIATASFMFTAALVGPTRMLLEGHASPATIRKLRGQVESLCLGYLEREALPKPRARRAKTDDAA